MHHWLEKHRLPGMHRFGRRTLILLHGGAVWVLFGWSIYAVPAQRFSGPPVAGVLLTVLDSPRTGLLWIIGGLLAILNAPFRKQWNGRDVAGFIGILTPPFVWFLAYFWSTLAYLIPDGTSGNARSLPALLLWYLISVFVLIVAGWPDPHDPAIEPTARDEAG